MEEKIFLAGLSIFAKFGPRRLKKLKNHFPNWQSAFESSFSDLKAAGIEEKIIEEFLIDRKKIVLKKLETILEEEKIKLIAFDDTDYPKSLRQISDPPALLYVRGNLRSNLPLLAVVGARKNTPYGERAISSLLPAVIAKNIGIVSGLALGTDARAHEKTLDCNGYTIAVLGTGIDRRSVYPEINKRLAEKIISSGGAVVSEFPPETPPLKPHFPLRNRIISGLSRGVLVVEAGIRSGSLITAHLALDENREVLAVPGSIFSSQSEGPNSLIKKGAKTVVAGNDILEIFGFYEDEQKPKKNKDYSNLSPEEQAIMLNLSDEPISANDLKNLTKLDIREINSTLGILEVRGIVKNYGGNYTINF